MSKPIAVVTGASSGLGACLVRRFAEHGFSTVGLFKSNTESASHLESKLRTLGTETSLVQLDITHDCSALVEHPLLANAHSIVLVNNAAAHFEPQPMHLYSWADYQSAYDVAVKGAFQCTMALLPRLTKTAGSAVVNVCSTAATECPKGFSSYAVAKAALLAFTRSLSNEYGKTGLKVFAVSPRLMQTPLTESWHPTFLNSVSKKQGPPLDPSEVAERIVSLLTNPDTQGRGEEHLIL